MNMLQWLKDGLTNTPALDGMVDWLGNCRTTRYLEVASVFVPLCWLCIVGGGISLFITTLAICFVWLTLIDLSILIIRDRTYLVDVDYRTRYIDDEKLDFIIIEILNCPTAQYDLVNDRSVPTSVYLDQAFNAELDRCRRNGYSFQIGGGRGNTEYIVTPAMARKIKEINTLAEANV